MELVKGIAAGFVILIAGDCFGQDFYLGLKGGLTQSKLTSDATTSPIGLQERVGTNLAFTLTFQAVNLPFLGFSFEPGYTLKGPKIKTDTLNYRFNYVTMPILLDLYPIQKIKVSVGPELGFLASAKNKLNDSTRVDLLDTYNQRFEFGGVAGISYSFCFFADLGIRYNRSFTTISKMDAVLDRKNLKNEYVQVFLVLKIAN